MIKIDKRILFNIFDQKFERESLLKKLPKKSVCVEIGIWKGDFSKLLLRYAKPKKLYLIDPWKFTPSHKDRWYGGTLAKNQKEMDAIYNQVKKDLSKNKSVKIIRKTSEYAAGELKDNYFDFVYVDGDHSTKEVYSDLLAYSKKLKKGGILAGDDFFWRPLKVFPVAQAVIKYYINSNYQLHITGKGYYFIKS